MQQHTQKGQKGKKLEREGGKERRRRRGGGGGGERERETSAVIHSMNDLKFVLVRKSAASSTFSVAIA